MCPKDQRAVGDRRKELLYIYKVVLCESRCGGFLCGILYFGNVMQTSTFPNDRPGMENTSGLLVV